MMIDKRLMAVLGESRKYIALNVLLQWLSLIANIVIMVQITEAVAGLAGGDVSDDTLVRCALVISLFIVVRLVCTLLVTKMSYLSSKTVKRVLREKIYRKLLRLGAAYKERVKTSEIVQVTVEGVEQLETYFGSYLPQFFYAMAAALTLFVCLSFVNLPSAAVLLVCVPMIPIAIAAVQTWAKKLLSKYWGQYAQLGDTFLENLQGLTTLKIYQADEYKNQVMNEEAEKFRKITMKVLTMQLNSITIMDVIAYGGAALGIIMAVSQYGGGNVSLQGCLLIVMLSAEFFLPMRLLGSYFHIAMNGMAASGKIFRLLELPEPPQRQCVTVSGDISCRQLNFAYEEERRVLNDVNMIFRQGEFTAIVGESGSGKSTVAGILMGRNRGYEGTVKIGRTELSQIEESELMKQITYIGHQSYLFKGTVRENLQMGKEDASQEEMWAVLDRVRLGDFLRIGEGLDSAISEKGSNLSGGQCQRLALARALLHDSSVYIFDEATSNIDIESENDIMAQIRELAKTKTVILISHRLANSVDADRIYVMERGQVAEEGSHGELLKSRGIYERLWRSQQSLERVGREALGS